jgi:hypothetical protein
MQFRRSTAFTRMATACSSNERLSKGFYSQFYWQTLRRCRDFAVYPTFTPRCETPAVPRSLEERIQQLCARISATEDEGELNRLLVELQKALSEHIQLLRQQVADYRASSKPRSSEEGE